MTFEYYVLTELNSWLNYFKRLFRAYECFPQIILTLVQVQQGYYKFLVCLQGEIAIFVLWQNK
jgi:hypothetical protein